MKKADGGGVKDSGEFIELFYLARQEAREFALSDDYIKPSSAIAAILWYFTEFKCQFLIYAVSPVLYTLYNYNRNYD